MSERNRGQVIHIAISIIGVLGTALGVYFANQVSIERFMSRMEQVVKEQGGRIDRLEAGYRESGNDRLTMERRVTGLEVGQNTMLGVLKEMRDDVRAVRERSKP